MSIIDIPFIFYYCLQTLFTLTVSSSLSSSSEANVDNNDDDENFLEFSLKVEFTSNLQQRIPALRTTATVLKPCWKS